MVYAIVSCALISGFASGAIVGGFGFEWCMTAKRQRGIRESMGSDSLARSLSLSLESKGLHARVLEFAIRNSKIHPGRPGSFPSFVAYWERNGMLVLRAGLNDVVTKEGFAYTCAICSLVGAIGGFLIGCLFSTVLSVIFLVVGSAWGWVLLPRALKNEGHWRCYVAEKDLSQMIEVVILGLKSGMTFDRALSLFHENFSGSLSSSLALVQSQWTHGLIERSEGLREVARSYESMLFERFAENVIRSLRFGTSLAENLSVLATEARVVRKAKMEEKVAKAPVKMLLPVGTLILPAMLILILGPIMLDLIQGT